MACLWRPTTTNPSECRGGSLAAPAAIDRDLNTRPWLEGDCFDLNYMLLFLAPSDMIPEKIKQIKVLSNPFIGQLNIDGGLYDIQSSVGSNTSA